MVLGENTSIYISLGTLIAILFFIWRISAYIKSVEMRILEIEKRLEEHEERDSKQNISVRLASIEESLVWIKNKMMGR